MADKNTKDRHKSTFMVRLPEEYREPLKKLSKKRSGKKKKTSVTKIVTDAIDKELGW